MAEDVVMVNSVKNTNSDTIESFYTSPSQGAGTIISAFTAANNSGANQSFKSYIFDSSGSILDAVIPTQIVIRNRTNLGASIVNQLIPPGGTLRMESSNAPSLSFRVTGREF